jgi:hypothetical protein
VVPFQLQRPGPFVEIEEVSSLSRPLIEFFSILLDLFSGKKPESPVRPIRDFDILKKLGCSDSN